MKQRHTASLLSGDSQVAKSYRITLDEAGFMASWAMWVAVFGDAAEHSEGPFFYPVTVAEALAGAEARSFVGSGWRFFQRDGISRWAGV